MIKLCNCDNLELMATLADESIDVICIDPPYLYLKNQKLERAFDEPLFFSECKRLLTKTGFIVMFGRGVSFYRWNTFLDGLGFTFKEEIVWDKSYTSSPVMAVSRVHETISIFSNGKGKINQVAISYIEAKAFNFESIHQDLKRIKSGLGNPNSLKALFSYIENGALTYDQGDKTKYTATIQSNLKDRDRAAATLKTIDNGLREKSIIKIGRDHYSTIHPTQKPVRLIERLLAIVIPDKPRNKIVVADFFAGSMSTMEAVHNMGMQGIATEIDEEYFLAGKARIESLQPIQQNMFA